jgi:hypothetical protein
MQSSSSVNGHAVLTDDERRKHKRKPVLWSARIEARDEIVPCIILDLSLGGAKLKGQAASARTRDRVMLVIDRFGAIPAEVVWSRSGHMGLRFTERPESVSHIIGAALPLNDR